MTPLLAVDGGGTSCRFALIWEGQRLEHEGPGANLTSDFDGAVAALWEGLEALSAKAGVRLDVLAEVPTYLGLAGMIKPELGSRLADAIPLARLRVQEDRPAAVVGALGLRRGVVAGLGTGSFVARQSAGGMAFVGGHGLVLGDDASGAWMGRSLLRQSLRASEGMCDATELTREVIDTFGGASEIILYAQAARPVDFARLAPMVVAAAEAEDAVAVALLQDGAAYIERALLVLGWRAGEAFCLLGGVANAYAGYLGVEIQASLVEPEGRALDGRWFWRNVSPPRLRRDNTGADGRTDL
ncbi:BadF/BadG/BcrA/BcrD ATPase family protein [Puniceibacterium sp. IMCC21224]|uniref:BadF/BadG/BcrA/BcrD ATPase family protein n=1 Tax=Puniceibacterium sp. IMCC21224 TaxID=1618204 RepID=UPI0009E60653|nr:BadF/BadG/BcrA/BcrD ATPase family protein [Puniceibacterium sp. IMCC21224]